MRRGRLATSEQNVAEMKRTPPSQWTRVPFADVGTEEPFIARITGLLDVLQATSYEKRDEIRDAVMTVLVDCLMPAFVSLRELRAIAGDPTAPILTKTKHFDDMCKSLWSAYKDRTQSAARLMGYEIGFLFQNDAEFEKGCAAFGYANPCVDKELIERMKSNRATWQPDLKRFRNDYLEHQKIPREEMAPFYSLQRAEELFERVWVAAEEILVLLMAARLPTATCLREIQEAERNPNNPKRFGFAWRPGHVPPESG